MVKVRQDIPVIQKQQIPKDLKGFYDAGLSADLDTKAWMERIQNESGIKSIDCLAKACEWIAQLSLNTTNYRSGTLRTGIGVADILSYLISDEESLCAAVLFRAAREGIITSDQIKERFGESVATLVADTLSMGRLSEEIEQNQRIEDHFEDDNRDSLVTIYKMLIAVTNDVRVVLIKLAERTFAVRELANATAERRMRVSREVMTIYAPLAHRLGIAQLKWELEDLAFRFLAPERYKEIASLLNEKRVERERFIEEVSERLTRALADQGLEAQVFGRVKHIYSIYKKMKLKDLSFEQLYDIRALRVLVPNVPDCYHALGVVHELWRHIPDQFDDYITNPKSNGYRSLHTAVLAQSRSLEVQIRTFDMHTEAEMGVCAHVNYKENTLNRPDRPFDAKLSTLRQLLVSYQDGGEDDEERPLQDWSELERIYVFTRDGDVQELSKGSTVLDFAYHVHTQVGNQCVGARVNQKYVPLTYRLKTGEQVEVMTKAGRVPNRDWLVPSLGYIKSSRARAKLKHWFNQQDREKNIEVGRTMLVSELTRLGLHQGSLDLSDYVKRFKVGCADDILVALVSGDINLNTLTEHISEQLHLEPSIRTSDLVPSVHPRATGTLEAYKIQIDGIDNIPLSIAQCCTPVNGELIAGYITRQNGVSIHRRECRDYIRLIDDEPDRAITATWYAQNQKRQQLQILIEAYDRRGLLKDLTSAIDREHVNILEVRTLSDEDGCANMMFVIEVAGLTQLSRLLARLEQQPGIMSARRVQAS